MDKIILQAFVLVFCVLRWPTKKTAVVDDIFCALRGGGVKLRALL